MGEAMTTTKVRSTSPGRCGTLHLKALQEESVYKETNNKRYEGLALSRKVPPPRPAEDKQGREPVPAGSFHCIRNREGHRAKHPDLVLPLHFQSPAGFPQMKSRDTALWISGRRGESKEGERSIEHQKRSGKLWMKGNSGLSYSEKICV